MRDNEHVSQERLHQYLDGELSDLEVAGVAAHLAACSECQSAAQKLHRLFVALAELAPAPDLVPGVLARLARESRPAPGATHGMPLPGLADSYKKGERPAPAGQWRRWLAPALEMAAVLALLIWAATRPSGYWIGSLQSVSSTLQSGWIALASWASGIVAGLPGWAVELPRTVAGWPAAAWQAARDWAGGLGGWGGLAPSQRIAGGVLLVGIGLVGNIVLLRRAALNGRHSQKMVER